MTIRLSKQFSIVSLISIVLIAILLGLLYRFVAVSHLKQQISVANTQLTQFIASTILSDIKKPLLDTQTTLGKQPPLHKKIINRLDLHIQQLDKDQTIVKIKIFNLAGFVVYSTQRDEIGNEVHDYDEFISAKQGIPASEMEFRDAITWLDGKTVLRDRDIVSTYIPVRDSVNNKVMGIFELYTDVTSEVSAIQKSEFMIHGSVFILLFFLYLFLYFYVRKADAIILQNEEELQIQQRKKLFKLANFDELTGLPNRNRFIDDLELLLSENISKPEFFAVLVINIDRMDWLNNYGVEFGNQVINTTAKYLNVSLRDEDGLYRIDGNEFAIVMRCVSKKQHVEIVTKRLQECFKEPMQIDGREIQVSLSIGVSMFTDDAKNKEELMAHATSAMHQAKDIGGNKYMFYSSDINKLSMQRYELETELHQALNKGQFEVYYQPKVDIQKGLIVGAEALLRWNHPAKGFIGPDEFISLLESTGHIIPVGQWVMEQSCRQCKIWHDAGFSELTVAVNVSAKQFNSDLLRQTKQVLFETDLAARYLELEITESVLAENIDKAIDTLASIKQTGIKLSIDDFGTGYSSLSYLAAFPVDHLKIDRSFVNDITTNKRNASITATIIAMSHALDMGVIVEGIETEDQLEYLCSMDCKIAQGYYFSRPVPADEFVMLLEAGHLKKWITA